MKTKSRNFKTGREHLRQPQAQSQGEDDRYGGLNAFLKRISRGLPRRFKTTAQPLRRASGKKGKGVLHHFKLFFLGGHGFRAKREETVTNMCNVIPHLDVSHIIWHEEN